VPLDYGEPPASGEIRQGELLKNVVEHRPAVAMDTSPHPPQFTPIVHDVVLVLSPDCDLERDYHTRFPDKAPEYHAKRVKQKGPQPWQLHHIRVCEVFDGQSIKPQMTNSGFLDDARKKTHDRFYQIPGGGVPAGQQFPELFLDFKMIFGMAPEALYAAMEAGSILRLGILQHPFITDVVSRSLVFEGRIALPERE
jgi:hypothetical protein